MSSVWSKWALIMQEVISMSAMATYENQGPLMWVD
jgi:hypothetical protein